MIKIEEGKRTPLKYTVADHLQIPEEAAKLIEEKKEKEFQMAYPEGRRPLSDKGIWKADERRIQHSGDGSVGICERCFF